MKIADAASGLKSQPKEDQYNNCVSEWSLLHTIPHLKKQLTMFNLKI